MGRFVQQLSRNTDALTLSSGDLDHGARAGTCACRSWERLSQATCKPESEAAAIASGPSLGLESWVIWL